MLDGSKNFIARDFFTVSAVHMTIMNLTWLWSCVCTSSEINAAHLQDALTLVSGGGSMLGCEEKGTELVATATHSISQPWSDVLFNLPSTHKVQRTMLLMWQPLGYVYIYIIKGKYIIRLMANKGRKGGDQRPRRAWYFYLPFTSEDRRQNSTPQKNIVKNSIL